MIPKHLYLLAHENKHYVFTMGDLNRCASAINRLTGKTDWTVSQLRLAKLGTDSAMYVGQNGEHITVSI